MNETNRIRVLIRCRSAGTDIFRTLLSLACQDVGPQCLEVALAASHPEAHTSGEARLLHKALGFARVDVLDACGLRPAQALNLAATGGDAGHLALVPEGARLNPRFLSRCLAACSAKPGAQAAFCAHTAGSPGSRAFTRRSPFRPEQLTRKNPVGPAVLVQRTAWDILGGLRPALTYSLWDFWLRLALAGGRLAEVPELLAACPPLDKPSPERDGRAKAQLVVQAPGVFEPDVCRWALSLLRGDGWAGPFLPGLIPGPRDVAALFAGFQPPLRPGWPGWDQHQRWSA